MSPVEVQENFFASRHSFWERLHLAATLKDAFDKMSNAARWKRALPILRLWATIGSKHRKVAQERSG
jgi:hypothetical protein